MVKETKEDYMDVSSINGLKFYFVIYIRLTLNKE